MPLQIRRGTNAERTAMTQALAAGELLYVTDTQRIYVGNGSTLGGVAVTGYTNEDAQDAVAPMLVNGTHSGITFTYGTVEDDSNVINATVDLSTYTGTIAAGSFKGTLVADDSTILVDGVSGRIVGPVYSNVTGDLTGNTTGYHTGDVKGSVFSDDSTLLVDGASAKINLNGTVGGNVVPDTTSAYDLGSSSYRFKDLYLSGSTIYLGSSTITSTGSVVNLPAGSTIGGQAISADGVVAGSNYNINIVGDDSTLIVNSYTKAITAAGGFTGDLTADNIYANDSGIGLNLRSKIGNSFCVDYYDGTKDSPVAITAGNNVGAISIKGWNGSIYAFAGTVYADWEATANTASDYPASTLVLVAGNNTSTPTTASLNSKGVFNAPVFKATSYASGSEPASPENGWIIYNSTTNKFQGRAAGVWVDLH